VTAKCLEFAARVQIKSRCLSLLRRTYERDAPRAFTHFEAAQFSQTRFARGIVAAIDSSPTHLLVRRGEVTLARLFVDDRHRVAAKEPFERRLRAIAIGRNADSGDRRYRKFV